MPEAKVPRGTDIGSMSEAKRCHLPLAQRQLPTSRTSQTLPAASPLTPPQQQWQERQQQPFAQHHVQSRSSLRSPRLTSADNSLRPSREDQPQTPISRAAGKSSGVIVWQKAVQPQGSGAAEFSEDPWPARVMASPRNLSASLGMSSKAVRRLADPSPVGIKNDTGSITSSSARLSDSARRRASVPGHVGSPRVGGSIMYIGDTTPGAPPPMVAAACHSPRGLSQQPSLRTRSPIGILPPPSSTVAPPVRRTSSPVGRQVSVASGMTAYPHRHGSNSMVLSPRNSIGVPSSSSLVRGTTSPMVPQGASTPRAPLISPRVRSSSPPTSRSHLRMNPPGPLVVPPTAQLPGLAVAGPLAGESEETAVTGNCTSSAVTYSL